MVGGREMGRESFSIKRRTDDKTHLGLMLINLEIIQLGERSTLWLLPPLTVKFYSARCGVSADSKRHTILTIFPSLFSSYLLFLPCEMTTDSLLVELTKVKRKKTEKFFTSMTKFSHRKRLANVLKSPRVRLRMSPHRANPFLFHSMSAERFRRKIFQSKTLHLRRNSFPLASVVESNAIGGEVSR